MRSLRTESVSLSLLEPKGRGGVEPWSAALRMPRLLVAPPNRRSRFCPHLLYEPGFEMLGYGPMGRAALWTCWRNQAMIIALRSGAEQHKLRVVEFDGHV